MTVNRTATAAGKRYERELLQFFRDEGLDCERLRLSGAEDEGDLLLRLPDRRVVVEAKRCKGLDLAGWVKEAQTEATNYDVHRASKTYTNFVVVHHARHKGIHHAYVTMPLYEWLAQVT